MGEIIQEVLLIESNGMNTKCLIVENLPKELLYYKTKKLMPMDEYSERLVPAFTLDEDGKRKPTGEMVDALLPGLEVDGAGSNGIIFPAGSNDANIRFKAILEHINKVVKDPDLRFAPVHYAQQPGSPSSAPKPYAKIPRVKLPLPDSPPDVPTSDRVKDLTPAKRVMSEEAKARLRINLAKARAAKNSTQA